jgi:hypothetical protein
VIGKLPGKTTAAAEVRSAFEQARRNPPLVSLVGCNGLCCGPRCVCCKIGVLGCIMALRVASVSAIVSQTCAELGRSRLDAYLIHWPCNAVDAGTLEAVWEEPSPAGLTSSSAKPSMQDMHRAPRHSRRVELRGL